MARFKMSAPGPTGEYGVEYVVNPAGAVWGVHEDHPAPGWPRYPADTVRLLVELAEKRDDGWRLATEDEIRKHCEATGDWLPPELEPKPKRAPAKEEPKAAADAPKASAAAAESGGPGKTAAAKE